MQKLLTTCVWRDCKTWLPICETRRVLSYDILTVPDRLCPGNCVLRFDDVSNNERLYEHFLTHTRACCVIRTNEVNLFGTKRNTIFHDAYIKEINLSDERVWEFFISYPFVSFIG